MICARRANLYLAALFLFITTVPGVIHLANSFQTVPMLAPLFVFTMAVGEVLSAATGGFVPPAVFAEGAGLLFWCVFILWSVLQVYSRGRMPMPFQGESTDDPGGV